LTHKKFRLAPVFSVKIKVDLEQEINKPAQALKNGPKNIYVEIFLNERLTWLYACLY
jgi:hypothetical protein